jgi:2-keto-4-pentenoate hydratase
MTSNLIDQAAQYLADMRFEMRTVDALPDAIRPTSLADAYQTQERMVTHLLAKRGDQPIGYKVACTSALAREQLRVPHPLFGQLLSFSTFASPATLRAKDFTVRTIEPEFGFQMAADVPQSSQPYTAERVAPFVGDAFPSIEIVDHRFNDWSLAGANSIAADNAIHGAWVYGAPFAAWRLLDLAAHEAVLTVNDREARRGTGAAVLDHPLNVIAWLANELPKYGKQLKRNDFITTGVVCDVYPAHLGDVMTADFGVMGRVTLAFN